MAAYPDDDFSDSSDDGFYYAPTANSNNFHLQRYSRPLIDFVRSEWYSTAKFTPPLHSRSPSDNNPGWLRMGVSLVSAPRLRRYLVAYLTLLLCCLLGWRLLLYRQLSEHESLLQALDPHSKISVGGWYGTNALPELEDLIRVRMLNPSLLPTSSEGMSPRRLIFIGDVHGCNDELDALLKMTSFNPSTDHLIFTGDLINKGPNSLEVVDLARKYSASCVRGNHEDRILTLRHSLADAGPAGSETNPTDELSNTREYKLARQLSAEQAQWLSTCPVILKVGQIPSMGEVIAVHGGLVPGVELEKQDPVSVMNMRTIDLETHVPSSGRDGTKWSKFFNKDQSLLYARIKHNDPDPMAKMTTVIYGHDAKTGIAIKPYTKGLDSNCVSGGVLSALVLGDGASQELVQVKCRDYRK